MAKTAMAALSAAVFLAAVILTIAFSSGRQAHADNTHGGAGETVTKGASPSTIETPSAAPVVTAAPYAP